MIPEWTYASSGSVRQARAANRAPSLQRPRHFLEATGFWGLDMLRPWRRWVRRRLPASGADAECAELARFMGTSVDHIDRIHGHRLPDSIDPAGAALDAFVPGRC